jgi:SAM-dependent methyltransferase
MNPRNHWQNLYASKKPTEVSWYQSRAAQSLKMIRRVATDRSTAIIDVGGGASTLVDGLLADGYGRVTVLDLSATALAAAAERLGESEASVTWIEADVLNALLPSSGYGLWHDRAVFHFLTEPADRRKYVAQVRSAVRAGGYVMIATFGPDGPAKCSGLDVVRYAPQELHHEFGPDFQLIESAREEHRTPSGAIQPFIYCLCKVTAA